jgi:hypothetical protein
MTTPSAAQMAFAAKIKTDFARSTGDDKYLSTQVLATDNAFFWIEYHSELVNVTPSSLSKMALIASAFDADTTAVTAPELVGSEKQVAYAQSIRELFFKIYTNAWPRLAAHLVDSASESSRERWVASLADLTEHLKTIAVKTSATFWIENRSGLVSGWVIPLRGIAKVRA